MGWIGRAGVDGITSVYMTSPVFLGWASRAGIDGVGATAVVAGWREPVEIKTGCSLDTFFAGRVAPPTTRTPVGVRAGENLKI